MLRNREQALTDFCHGNVLESRERTCPFCDVQHVTQLNFSQKYKLTWSVCVFRNKRDGSGSEYKSPSNSDSESTSDSTSGSRSESLDSESEMEVVDVGGGRDDVKLSKVGHSVSTYYWDGGQNHFCADKQMAKVTSGATSSDSAAVGATA